MASSATISTPYLTLCPSRYSTQLKRARSEGVKKSFFTAMTVGAFYFIIFCTFALGFW